MDALWLDVKLLRGSSVIRGVLHASEAEPHQHRVEVAFNGYTIVGSGPDYFEALVDARRRLESEGLLICVAGARKDVWPSPMARSMGGGLKAYRMTLGLQALSRDLVEIFSESENPSSVREQEAFRDAWFESLGLPSRSSGAT